MPLIQSVRGFSPVLGNNMFIAENATIVGQVTIGNGCSIWFNAVIRGDVNSIEIGNDTNIQDGVIIHGTYEKASTKIGNKVSIGHRALVHGCQIHDFVLIGMGAIIMDHAIVESNCIIAAGSVVLQNFVCEAGYLYAGTPAKKIKLLTNDQLDLLQKLPANYQLYATWF